MNAAFNLNPLFYRGLRSGLASQASWAPRRTTRILAGIHDINGGPNRGIQSFFEDKEYFKAVEIGWDTRLDAGNGNTHALFWETDRKTSNNTPGSRGFTVGGEQEFGHLLPFIRYYLKVVDVYAILWPAVTVWLGTQPAS